MNSYECQEDARFAEILELDGFSIQDYYDMGGELFPDAQVYPNFFNENLVSPNRVLKVFKDNVQSNIKIFYIQILRLAYEISLEDNNSKIFMLNLRRIVFHPEFEILFTQETEEKRDLYNDFQFKKLFAEFLVVLDRQQSPNILQILSQYPIMDTIFVHILRSLLASQNVNEEFDVKIPTDVVFGQLASLTQLTVTSFGNCWKFQDSDMFCYQENENELYLAYITDDGVEENTQNSQQYPTSNNQQTKNNYQPPRPQPVIQYPSNTTQMQKSMTSQRPTASMISQNYQFTDYLGATTIQKHKVPRNQKQKQDGLANNFTGYLNKAQNNIKSSFAYQNPTNDYKQTQYSSTDYFSNTYDNKRNNDYKESNYGSYQSYNTKPIQNKPYESSYSKNDSYKYNDSYSSSYKPDTYKPVEYISSTVYRPQITGKTDYFKPVEPTPLPNFDSYKSTYVQPKRETSYGNYGGDNYKSTSSAVYESNYKSTNNSYKPSYQTSGVGDYYNDFTSPDILSKLRPEIRENINKIKESMRGVVKGAELPPDFDIRKSAVFSNNSGPKQQLFRNQSRSQFQYVETHKTNPSKPFTADLSQYTSNRFSSNFAY